MTLVADFNPSVTVPFSRMRQLLQDGVVQEGVIASTDFKAVQRAAGANMSVDVGAGLAWITIDTGTRNGIGHATNDATANVVVTASNATNPRIDQVLLRWNDTNIPTGSGNVPTLEVLAGTATSGATLDNRTGATALPNDCLRLADILVPATSTTVTTANIRDRRSWARGAHYATVYAGGNITTTATALQRVDSTNLEFRVECTGVPIIIEFQCSAVGAGGLEFGLAVDAVERSSTKRRGESAGSTASVRLLRWEITNITAGSHLFAPMWCNISAGTATILASSNYTADLTIREDPRQNANNV